MNFNPCSDRPQAGPVSVPLDASHRSAQVAAARAGMAHISLAHAWQPAPVGARIQHAAATVAETALASGVNGDGCAPLIARLQALAKTLAPDIPIAIVSRPADTGHDLPLIESIDASPSAAALLEAWASILLEACTAGDDEARWLLTQVFALRLAHAGMPQMHALHRTACAHARHGEEQAQECDRPAWRARRIELDLALTARLSGAARLFALRDMITRHAAAVVRGEAAVLRIWIDVLLHAAPLQGGTGGAGKLAEAVTVAERLRDLPAMTDEADHLLARVLLRRAAIEHGDTRTRTLAEAQRLLDALFARAPSARIAMAVAEAALARGRDDSAHAAKGCFSHALAHAFIAGCDPRWQAASLQCRLAIQLAYESLPDMSPQGHVALDLARKLEYQPLPPADAIEGMAQTFIRHGEYARACRLCARAWLAGTRFRTLSAAWQEASAGWKQGLASAREHAGWQDNERQRRIAAQWH